MKKTIERKESLQGIEINEYGLFQISTIKPRFLFQVSILQSTISSLLRTISEMWRLVWTILLVSKKYST